MASDHAEEGATDEELARWCQGRDDEEPDERFDPSALSKKNDYGRTCWHAAATDGRIDILIALKRRGLIGDINVLSGDDDCEQLPIDAAIENGHAGAARWLITNGADVVTLLDGFSLFGFACGVMDVEFIKWLQDKVPHDHVVPSGLPDSAITPMQPKHYPTNSVAVLQHLILVGCPVRKDDWVAPEHYGATFLAKLTLKQRSIHGWCVAELAVADQFRSLILGCGVHATATSATHVNHLPKLRGYVLTEVRACAPSRTVLPSPTSIAHL